VFRKGTTTIAEHWRFATVRESTRDEDRPALSNLLGLRGLKFADIEASIIFLDGAAALRAVDGDVRPLSRTRDAGRRALDPDRMPIRMDNPRESRRPAGSTPLAAYDLCATPAWWWTSYRDHL